MMPSRKGSRTIISTVVSGDSVQQNDSRGQVDERRLPQMMMARERGRQQGEML